MVVWYGRGRNGDIWSLNTGTEADMIDRSVALMGEMEFAADDRECWAGLLRARGYRAPNWSTRLTARLMERWLKRLGVGVAAYLEWTGTGRLRDWIAWNPAWPLRAWLGLVLEWQGE